MGPGGRIRQAKPNTKLLGYKYIKMKEDQTNADFYRLKADHGLVICVGDSGGSGAGVFLCL